MTSKKVALIAGSVVLAAGVTGLGIELSKNSTDTSEKKTASQEIAAAKEYSANSSYISPAGTEKVSLKMNIKEGVVESSDFTVETESNTSKKFIAAFESAYKTEVVGKKISEIKLSRIAGASLTTNGFNDALQRIESQIGE